MDFAGLNYISVIAAAVASYAFGAAWYMGLSKQWLAAIGKTKEDAEGGSMLPLVISFAAQLVMAYVLAGLIGHLGEGNVTARNGIISGAFVWFGFVATTLATNHAFEGARPSLTLIDGGHWLGVLLIQGAIIGWLGVQ